jgi:hypothetical protein
MKFARIALLLTVSLSLTLTMQAQSIEGSWEMTTTDPEGKSTTHIFKVEGDTYMLDWMSDGTTDVIGNFVIADGQITIWDVDGNPDIVCGEEAKGHYKLSVSESEFSMELIEDACEGRGNMGTMLMTRM